MIRNILEKDLGDLKGVIDSNELFPSDMLDDMVASYFSHMDSLEIWVTKEVDGRAIAVAYCAPERMTVGTYNLYLIAVHKSAQGSGVGTELMGHVEAMLRNRNARILLVETSGLEAFARTRGFYDRLGYRREALIREFYQEGEDKVVFWKHLGGSM